MATTVLVVGWGDLLKNGKGKGDYRIKGRLPYSVGFRL